MTSSHSPPLDPPKGTATYIIRDAEGERHVGRDAFPLAIGGDEADIRLDGFDGAEPLAWLGLAEGDLFVQPEGEETSVTCNGTKLTASHWLEDGDVLGLGPARLHVELEGGEARFVIREAPERAGAKPVVLTPPPPKDREGRQAVKIRPIAFQPAGGLSSSGRGRRLRWSTVLAFLFLAALGAAAAFVFTSRSILVEIEPPPDRLAVEGGFAFEIAGRYLLRPGDYVVVAEKAGFRRLEEPFEVTRESNQTFRWELERLPGLLEVRVGSVEGARILVDGEARATTPVTDPLELSPGEHEIRIRAEGYREYTARVSIEGAGVTQTLEAELVAVWAPVAFTSNPGGATVRVDGAAVGKTPVTARLVEGNRVFEIVLAGYKPYRGRVRVRAGEEQTVPKVTLARSDGNVVLVSEPSGAAVTVDGVYRGEAPVDLDLEPGRGHLVKVSKAGYRTETKEVEVAPEEARELRVVLAPEEGELKIATWPSDAELYVDGERQAQASATLHLAAVAHEIEVRKAGYAPYRTTVTPRPGFPQLLEVDLKSLEEKKAEATPQVLRTSEGYELRRIEPGRFLMGASRREAGRRSNEALREVELTRAFYLGTMEISNRQYRRFKEEHLSGQVGGHTLDVDDHPVVGITWEEAAEYCNWLSAQEALPPAYVVRDGKLVLADPQTTGYRLPTEAEWAWAARFPDGKTAIKFPWGKSLPVPPASGNYADASAREILPGVLVDYNDQHPVTSPVTGFAPSALGLFNLGGNVAEWVHDYYAIRPAGSDKVARDPFGPEAGDFHVIRGSSWMHSTVTELRLTYRDYGDKARPDVGFRIARYVE